MIATRLNNSAGYIPSGALGRRFSLRLSCVGPFVRTAFRAAFLRTALRTFRRTPFVELPCGLPSARAFLRTILRATLRRIALRATLRRTRLRTALRTNAPATAFFTAALRAAFFRTAIVGTSHPFSGRQPTRGVAYLIQYYELQCKFLPMTARASMHASTGRKREPAVVLIHGFPLTREIWEAQADALARTSCVLRPDLRGAGTSSAPEGPYLMERLAADIAARARRARHRARGARRSFDGRIRRARVRAHVYRARGAARARREPAARRYAGEAAARRELADRVERRRQHRTGNRGVSAAVVRTANLRRARRRRRARATRSRGRTIRPESAATLRGMALRASSEDIAEDLDVPMLLIAGAHDRVVGLEEARAIVGAISARAARGLRARAVTSRCWRSRSE